MRVLVYAIKLACDELASGRTDACSPERLAPRMSLYADGLCATPRAVEERSLPHIR